MNFYSSAAYNNGNHLMQNAYLVPASYFLYCKVEISNQPKGQINRLLNTISKFPSYASLPYIMQCLITENFKVFKCFERLGCLSLSFCFNLANSSLVTLNSYQLFKGSVLPSERPKRSINTLALFGKVSRSVRSCSRSIV